MDFIPLVLLLILAFTAERSDEAVHSSKCGGDEFWNSSNCRCYHHRGGLRIIEEKVRRETLGTAVDMLKPRHTHRPWYGGRISSKVQDVGEDPRRLQQRNKDTSQPSEAGGYLETCSRPGRGARRNHPSHSASASASGSGESSPPDGLTEAREEQQGLSELDSEQSQNRRELATLHSSGRAEGRYRRRKGFQGASVSSSSSVTQNQIQSPGHSHSSKHLLIVPLRFVSSRGPSRSSLQQRHLEELSAAELHGSLVTLGYYYVDIWLGVPSQRFSLLVDTGSALTFVPCASCGKNCGAHMNPPYNPDTSTTYEAIPCSSSHCLSKGCNKEHKCTYHRKFAENSSTAGVLTSDAAFFQGPSSSITQEYSLISALPRVIFGCAEEETGQLFGQKADGVLGLGRGVRSVVRQMANRNGLAREFSLCYGGAGNGEGVLMLGGGRESVFKHMVYTTLSRKKTSYFQVTVKSIRVAGQDIPVSLPLYNGGYGAIVDSGTTFTYFPRPVFRAFRKVMLANMEGMKQASESDPHYHSLCFKETRQTNWSTTSFPRVEFVFGAGVLYSLEMDNYIFPHHVRPDLRCIGVYPNPDAQAGLILGALLWKDTLVRFDMENERLGLLKTDCAKLGIARVPSTQDSENGAYQRPPQPDAGEEESEEQIPQWTVGQQSQQKRRAEPDILSSEGQQVASAASALGDDDVRQQQQSQAHVFARAQEDGDSVAAALALAGVEIGVSRKTTPLLASQQQPSSQIRPLSEDSLVRSWRAVDPRGCDGCAAYVDISLTFYQLPLSQVLSTNDNPKAMFEFLPPLVKANLSLLPRQVQLRSVEASSVDMTSTVVKLRVVPFGTNSYMQGAITQRVISGISLFQLPVVYLKTTGPFRVSGIFAAPPPFMQSPSPPPVPTYGQWRTWVFTSLGVLVLVLVVVWVWKCWRDKQASKAPKRSFLSMVNMSKREEEEQATSMPVNPPDIVTRSTGTGTLTTVCHSPKRALTAPQV